MAKNMQVQGVGYYSQGFGVKKYTHTGNGAMDGNKLSTNESFTQTKINDAGTYSNLRVVVASGRADSNTFDAATTLTLRDDGAATSVTLTIPATTSGVFEDTVNTASPASGSLMSIEWDITAPTAGSCKLRTISIMYDAASSTEMWSKLVAGYNDSIMISAAGTFYINAAGRAVGTPIENDCKSEVTYAAATWKNLSCQIGINNQTTSSTIRSRVNGANGNQVITVTASSTGTFQDTSNTDSLSAGDEINYMVTTSSSGIFWGGVWYSDLADSSNAMGMSIFHNQNTAWKIAAGAISFLPVSGHFISTPPSSETDASVPFRFNGTARDCRVYVSANAANQNATWTLRKNAADTSLAVTITSLTTGEFKNSTDVSFSSGDLLAFKPLLSLFASGDVTVNDSSLCFTNDDIVFPVAGVPLRMLMGVGV